MNHDEEDFEDTFDMNDAEPEYEENVPTDLPWGMLALAALGGAIVYSIIKKGSNAATAAANSGANALIPVEACVQVSPLQLPEYTSKGWQIYPISNNTSGGMLWACPPGQTPPA